MASEDYISNLRNVEISDISFLMFYQRLKKLITPYVIEDLSPLQYVPDLEYLDLSHCIILRAGELKYESLALLRNLKYLNLRYTDFDGTPNLNSLTQLEELNISRTKIRSIECFRDCRSIKRLNLSKTPIIDFPPLHEFSHLEHIIAIGVRTPIDVIKNNVNMSTIKSIQTSKSFVFRFNRT